jgi:hypothetical protein
MLRLTSTEPVTILTPQGEWIIDPVARTVDEQDGEEPRPFTEFEEELIPSVEQIAEFAAEDLGTSTVDAAEELRALMFALTDEIIDWCQDSQAYLYTSGAQGAFDVPRFMALLQTAEGYLLTFKSLTLVPDAVRDQRDWMLQRGQQAQSILALAAVMN